MAAKVDIYTKFGCGFCYRAKSLLDSKGVDFNEYDITMGGEKKDEMLQRAPGARTVPQTQCESLENAEQVRAALKGTAFEALLTC